MGGAAAGEQASAAALEALDAAWRGWQPADSPSAAELERALGTAGRAADAAVLGLASERPEHGGSATTLTAAACAADVVSLLHAGDSRAYRIDRTGAITQLTEDHTWVGLEVSAGRLTPEEAGRHPQRNVITEYLGKDGGAGFDLLSYRLDGGDVLVLCTDGVSNVLTDDELAESVHPAGAPDANGAVARAIGLVAQRAGGDDATAVVLHPVHAVAKAAPAAAPGADPFGLRRAERRRAPRTSRRPLLLAAGATLGVAAAAGLGVAGWRAASEAMAKYPPLTDAERYVAAWKGGEYEALYGLTSAATRREIDREAFVRRHQAIAAEMTVQAMDLVPVEGAPQPAGAQLALSSEATQPYEVVYRTARFGEIRRRAELPLVWEEGRWAVQWSPALLLPELNGGRLVRAFSDPAPRGSILDRARRPLAVTQGTGRVYPTGSSAGPLIGYTGQITAEEVQPLASRGYVAGDVVGRAGIESAAETLLAGQRGGRLTVVQPNGDVAETLSSVPPRAGESVALTIDAEIQRDVESILGDRVGSAIVLDSRSGAIRALASFPRYDPAAFGRGGDAAVVLNDPGQPLLLRPAQGQYPPGSVFKVITMAAALESGAFTPESEFTCTGRWSGLPGLTFDCWLRTGHGRQDLVSGLTHSCNTVFYEIGKRLDEMDSNLLPSFAARAGIGAATGVLPAGEAAGIAPSPAWKQRTLRDGWARGDAVNMAIGQGNLLVTPLQLAQVYAGIATSGQGPGLKLLDRALLPGGSVERTLPASTFKLPWSGGTLEAIRAGLRNVVGAPDGTAAFVFQGSPLAGLAAGKTGTAETGGGRPSHAWFACYAPFDAPRAVVLVMLEHGGEGSSAAAPVARRILESVLDRL